jgi:mRNA deadenylase 3'-5' endonuclease subunit Ccr4
MNRLSKDNIAQILVLESLARTNNIKNVRNCICVVNTHLYSNHLKPDVKLWQTYNLIQEIQRFVSARDLSLIMCGDFNSEPESAVYEYITTGCVSSNDHPELYADVKQNSLQILPRDLKQIKHNIELSSVMSTVLQSEPSFTNYTSKFKGTLDYIFYSTSRIRVIAVTSIPAEEDIRLVSGEGLPSACYPSDHILLCTDVALLQPQHVHGVSMFSSSNSNSLNNSTINNNGSSNKNHLTNHNHSLQQPSSSKMQKKL